MSKLAKLVDTLRLEKQALQDDAMHLSDRQMQLSHANRMLANELHEQQRGTGLAGGDSGSFFSGGASGELNGRKLLWITIPFQSCVTLVAFCTTMRTRVNSASSTLFLTAIFMTRVRMVVQNGPG